MCEYGYKYILFKIKFFWINSNGVFVNIESLIVYIKVIVYLGFKSGRKIKNNVVLKEIIIL